MSVRIRLHRPWPRGRGVLAVGALAILATLCDAAGAQEEGRSRRIISEGEWAAELVDRLGLTAGLPEPYTDDDLFSLLCADRAGARRAPGGSFQVSAAPPRRRRPTDPVRVVVQVPATALYQVSVEGVGRQRWVVDQHAVGHLDLSELGVAFAPAVVPLARGPHELTAYLGRLARVERVELSAYRPLCIAPARGWRADRPLTFGARARTLVRAFGFESRLPEDGEPLRIEGERYQGATAGGGRTHRRLADRASSGSWATAAGGPAEFTYPLHVEAPGVFSIIARVIGRSEQVWSVDGRYRAAVAPKGAHDEWVEALVLTVPLAAGEHALRVLVPRAGGIDVIRVVRHRSADGDYVSVLEEAGFAGSAPGAPVTRALALEEVVSPGFAALARNFQHRLAGARDDDPIALVDHHRRPHERAGRPLSPTLPAEL